MKDPLWLLNKIFHSHFPWYCQEKKFQVGSAAQLLQSYSLMPLNRNAQLNPYTSPKPMTFQVPVCIQCNSYIIWLQYLLPYQCNYTPILLASGDLANYQVIKDALLTQFFCFLGPHKVVTTSLPKGESAFCYRHLVSWMSVLQWAPCYQPPIHSGCLLFLTFDHFSQWLIKDMKIFTLQWENRILGFSKIPHYVPFYLLTGAALAGTLGNWKRENKSHIPL